MAHGLRAVGVRCDEKMDGLTIYPSDMHSGDVAPRGDHRILMAFEVLNRLSDVSVSLNGQGLAAVSYPSFYDDLDLFAPL